MGSSLLERPIWKFDYYATVSYFECIEIFSRGDIFITGSKMHHEKLVLSEWLNVIRTWYFSEDVVLRWYFDLFILQQWFPTRFYVITADNWH